MTPERWQQIEEVFQTVVELTPGERSAILAERGKVDPELVAEVRKLLEDYDEAGDFIESPVWTDSIMLGATARDEIGGAISREIEQDDASLIGRRLGVYRLVSEIGRGGMGAVYLAERDDGEFRQRAAVKIVKRGMDTDFIVRRFRNERQILAALDHPYIARLYDGGTTDDGLPFFVMEYIEGAPVYGYSDARKLSIAERLQLFVRICEAVEYAHENLIIHRDIKPSNIIVTTDGTPKLLDFGIAKILDPELAGDSIDPTATAMRMMTPEYASPEQVRGEAVTKSSDVYSLGVLLYELLTGHRPYHLKNRAIHEMARVICEDDPESFASSLTRDGNFAPGGINATVESVFDARGGDIDSLRRELSGGLERIVFKALRKNAADRYESARHFADDIRRHVAGEPVQAPEVQSEHMTAPIFSKPDPGELSIAVLPLKLFGGGTGEETGDEFLSVGLADALISRLSNIPRFIVRPTSSVLKYGSLSLEPLEAGAELGVNFLVDGNIRRVGSRLRVSVQLLSITEGAAKWAERFDEELTDVLSLEDIISEKVAEALLPQLTGDELDKIRKRGTDSAEAYKHYLHGRHYWNLFTEEGFAKAIVAYYQAIAHDPKYALAYSGIADYHNWLGIYGILPSRECFQSAIENALKAIELDPNLSEAYAALAFAQHGGSFLWEESEKNFETALRLGPNVAETHVWYSIKRTTEARFVEGITHAAKAVELDPQTPFNQHNLGWILYFARQYDEALRQYRKTARLFPEYPLAHYGLAWILRRMKRFDEAFEHIEILSGLLKDSIFALHVKGQTLAAAGRSDEARVVLEELSERRDRHFTAPYQTALIHAYLGETEEALDFLEESVAHGDAWLVWLGVEPAFDKIRREPRFATVMEATRNPILKRDGPISTNDDIHQSNIATRIMPAPATSEMKDQTEKVATNRRRRRFFVVAGVSAALLFLAVFSFRGIQKLPDGGWHIAFGSESKPPIPAPATTPNGLKTIGILPFERDFSSENDESLATGLADAISQKLRQVKEVSLRFAFLKPGTSNDPAILARDYGVDYVLRGKLHVIGERVLIDAELLSTANGKTIWLEKFEDGVNNFQTLQTAISERVLKAMTIELSTKERTDVARNFTDNVDAYRIYLAGRFQLSLRNPASLKKAEAAFLKAVEMDPRFALAYSGLADAHLLMNLYQIPPPPNAFEKAKSFAQKAIEIDPSLSEAHASLGYILFYDEGKRREAIAELERAVELNPTYSTAHHWRAMMLSAMGLHQDAIPAIEKAISLEPRSAIIHAAAGSVYFYARRYDEALKATDNVLGINEGFVPAYKIKRSVYEALGNGSAALSAYQNERIYSESIDEEDEGWLMIAAQVTAVNGNREEALTMLKRAASASIVKNSPSAFAYEMALGYTLAGDVSSALDWLEKAKTARAYGFNFAKVDPRLDTLRENPRFVALISQL